MGRLILVEKDSTVHFKAGEATTLDNGVLFEPIESKVVLAGQTIDPANVPSYLLESVKQGKAPGLTLLTEAQARKVLRDAAIARGELDSLQEEVEEEKLAEKS